MTFSFEEIVKIIELLLVLFSLILVIFGWIIPYKQSVKTKKDQWKKELIDKQIADFYGPIAELLREQALIRKLIGDQLGRDIVFSGTQMGVSDLPKNEQKIWMHFIDTYSIPIQKRILNIIQSNQHLVYKSKFPDCFKTFMQYVIGWELLDSQKRNGVPNHYQYHNSSNYPTQFNFYIEETLASLVNDQKALIE